MSKKSDKDKKKAEAYLENYRGLVQKLRELSKLSTRQFLGTRADGDPRTTYLTDMEAFKNLANVHLEVILKLTMSFLGVPRAEFLKLQEEMLTNQVKAMEADLCVTGWDQSGNPIFDLPRYMERTKLWPK